MKRTSITMCFVATPPARIPFARALALLLALLSASILFADVASAARRSTRTTTSTALATSTPAPESTTLIGMRAPGALDPYTFPAVAAWQGKPNAVGVTFAKTNVPAAQVLAKLVGVWNAGSIPVLTIEPIETNDSIVSGIIDGRLGSWLTAIKPWLAGPDAVFGNADDRRMFVRLAHEANGSWYTWSPCSLLGGSTPENYKAMWRHVHATLDVGDAHMSWIFSMNQGDTAPRCAAELLYPGDAYVDWLGMDAYTRSKYQTPESEFGPMLRRLRALAPTKPMSINEAGVSQVVTGNKAQWIRDYYVWIHANDIRMVTYFNVESTRDWTVFGLISGNETFAHNGVTYRAWSAYREAVSASWAKGSDLGNPRLITDAQFQGR